MVTAVIGVSTLLDGERAARCPTTRQRCFRGCTTICLLPKQDGPGPLESCASCGKPTGGSSDPALHTTACSNVNPVKYPHHAVVIGPDTREATLRSMSESAKLRGRRPRFSEHQQASGFAVNVSKEFREHVRKAQQQGEAMEDTMRRLMGMQVRVPL